MKAIFVTGTDTEVGKTVIAGLLARYLLNKGLRVITQKWVQTGSVGFPVDIEQHLKLMKKKKKYVMDDLADINPYNFKFASSPHLAARLENKRINIAKIKKSFNVLSEKYDFVIVEGIGGALVPLSKNRLVIDIAQELKLPVLVVSGNKLGAINHTLLTLEALKSRNMKIEGIIFNNIDANGDEVILNDNPEIIKAVSKENILGILPKKKNMEVLYENFIPIVGKLFKKEVIK
jgi:dethiobiotin synthetase